MVKMHRPSIRIAPLGIKPAQTQAAARRTKGSAWMKIRDRIMARDCGICRCEECATLGRTLIATEVDHIIPLEQGGTDEDSNLRAINADCHAKKTAQEARERAGRSMV